MSRKDLRTNRLRELCDAEGGYVNVARIAAVSADNLWQIINATPLPSGNPRGLGDKLADKIERAFEKPRGWFDTPDDSRQTAHHVSEPLAHYRQPRDWPFAVNRSRFDRLSAVDKGKVNEYMELLVIQQENASHGPASGTGTA